MTRRWLFEKSAEMPMEYRDQTLYLEEMPLADIARREGTPSYVYSRAAILDRFQAYEHAFGDVPHKVCYAVKANSNLSILKLLAEAGAGFDIVSGGELFRVLKAGADPETVIFSGVGKTSQEIDYALEHQIQSFNCESEPELALIDSLAARRGIQARVALRVNPDVDAATHPYISTGLRNHKFGIDIADAEAIYERARALQNLSLEGVSCHIGSQITDIAPMLEVFDKMIALVERLRARGLPIRSLDLGGGLGVAYEAGRQIAFHLRVYPGYAPEHGRTRSRNPDRAGAIHRGRSGPAAHARAVSQEQWRSAIRDRRRRHERLDPSRALPVSSRNRSAAENPGRRHHRGRRGTGLRIRRFFGSRPRVPNVLPGDLLAVCTAGAYGFVASSNYNSRPRPPEILVEGDRYRVIRKREKYEDLIRGE